MNLCSKALIIVMPILGIGYLITMVGPDPSNPWAHNIFQVIRCVLLSTQVTTSYLIPDVIMTVTLRV